MFRRISMVAALGTLATMSMGCSVIGFTAGAIHDSREPDMSSPTTADVLTLGRGSRLSVDLRGGSTISGKLVGPVAENGDAYRASFAEARESLQPELRIPALGSFVKTDHGADERDAPGLLPGELLGWNRDSVFLKGPQTAWATPWTDIPFLTGTGTGSIHGSVLADLTVTGQIPALDGISIRRPNSNATVTVLFKDVDSYRVQSSRNAKWKGLAIGTLLDIFLVYATVESLSDLSIRFKDNNSP